MADGDSVVEFRGFKHGMRVPTEDDVELGAGFCELLVAFVPDVRQRDEEVYLGPEVLGLADGGGDGGIPQVSACKLGFHPLCDHGNTDAQNSYFESVLREREA